MTRNAREHVIDTPQPITIVSGLPRSGKSLLLPMLEAAGLEVATDGRRLADSDNPKGYFELDAVKRLRADSSFLEAAIGQAVKVVSPLVPFLPPGSSECVNAWRGLSPMVLNPHFGTAPGISFIDQSSTE